jgi:hypothetical protein
MEDRIDQLCEDWGRESAGFQESDALMAKDQDALRRDLDALKKAPPDIIRRWKKKRLSAELDQLTRARTENVEMRARMARGRLSELADELAGPAELADRIRQFEHWDFLKRQADLMYIGPKASDSEAIRRARSHADAAAKTLYEMDHDIVALHAISGPRAEQIRDFLNHVMAAGEPLVARAPTLRPAPPVSGPPSPPPHRP